jgi:hypothetical protein
MRIEWIGLAGLMAGEALAGQCGCDDLDFCTNVNKIPLEYATSPVVYHELTEQGAKPDNSDEDYLDNSETFDAPPKQPYTKIHARYADQQLAELEFEYPASKLQDLLEHGFPIGREGVTHGDFRNSKASEKPWLMDSGVVFRISRKPDSASVLAHY